MARAIFIFILAALIAAAVVWIVSFPGWVSADWLGYRYEGPVSLTLLGLAGLFVALHFLFRVVHAIAGGPRAWQRRAQDWRARRGMGALTHGLASAAAGDASAAHKEAARAGRLVKNGPLAQVLALEAAALEGRDKDVASLAPGLLNHPETELLGRRALFDLARARGDEIGAADQAEAAFGNHPAAGWAAEALVAHALQEGDHDRAQSVVQRAARHDAFPSARAKSIKAAIYLNDSMVRAAEGDAGKASTLARKALEADENLVAAAVARAGHLADAGKPKAVFDVARKVWGASPHPDLGHLVARGDDAAGASETASRVDDLIRENPDHVESRLLLAETADVAPGERVFDVKVQGETVKSGYDTAAAAGASNRADVVEVSEIAVHGELTIELIPVSGKPPRINSIEIDVSREP